MRDFMSETGYTVDELIEMHDGPLYDAAEEVDCLFQQLADEFGAESVPCGGCCPFGEKLLATAIITKDED